MNYQRCITLQDAHNTILLLKYITMTNTALNKFDISK